MAHPRTDCGASEALANARSWLVVAPDGDAPRAAAPAADALVVDLAGADPRCAARGVVEDARAAGRGLVFVRVTRHQCEAGFDLYAVAAGRPDGFMLAGARCAADVQRLAASLAVAEARAGLDDGAVAIVAMLDRGASFLQLASFQGASDRLVALAWDGESLARDVGAEAARDGRGAWLDPCAVSRSLTLSAAAAAGLVAIDAPFPRAGARALRTEANAARRDGFSGKIALDAAQAKTINRAFAPRETARG